MKKSALLVPLSLALAACGGSSYSAPEDLAAALGCSDSFQSSPGAVTSSSIGTCQWNGHQVSLLVGSPESVDLDIKIATEAAAAFGVSAPSVVQGESWAVLTASQVAAEKVASRVGGDLP